MQKWNLVLIGLLWVVGVYAQPATYYQLNVKKGQLRNWLKPENNDQPIISAHRGGRYYPGYPENALETFQYTLSQTPAMIECDVEMTSDSVLVLLHDRSLDRTTTGTGKIKEKPWSYVNQLQLIDDFGDTTNFKVPTLDEALKWSRKNALLELDVKRGVPFEKVIEAVKKNQVEDYVIIITYNIKDAQKVHTLNPSLMISIGIRNLEEFNKVKASGIPFDNLIAFTGTRLSDPSLYQTIHKMNALTILGTMGNLDNKAKARSSNVYQDCVDKGVDVLATDRPIEAAKDLGVVPENGKIKSNYYSFSKKGVN